MTTDSAPVRYISSAAAWRKDATMRCFQALLRPNTTRAIASTRLVGERQVGQPSTYRGVWGGLGRSLVVIARYERGTNACGCPNCERIRGNGQHHDVTGRAIRGKPIFESGDPAEYDTQDRHTL